MVNKSKTKETKREAKAEKDNNLVTCLASNLQSFFAPQTPNCRGDLIVVFDILFPTSLPQNKRDLLKDIL